MASVSKEQQQEAERVASVWNSPAPFKAATETHFVKVLGSGLSSSEDQDEDDTTLWRGTVANEFLTGVAVFGGCVVAIFVNAAKNEVARRGLQAKFPDVVSVSSTFLAPGKGGPLDITISTLRQGGRFLVLEYMVKQNQGGQFFKIVTGTITFSDMNGEEKAEGMTDMKQIPFPTLPPRDKCSKNSWAGHKGRPANTMWDLMTTLEPPFGERELEPAQLTRGWTKWARWTRDGDDARTPESLAFFSDLYGMPAMSKMGAWFPTMDIQIQFRQLPAPTDGPWIRIRSVSKYTINGRKEFDVEIWNEDGTRLLALARQMSIIVDFQKRLAKQQKGKL